MVMFPIGSLCWTCCPHHLGAAVRGMLRTTSGVKGDFASRIFQMLSPCGSCSPEWYYRQHSWIQQVALGMWWCLPRHPPSWLWRRQRQWQSQRPTDTVAQIGTRLTEARLQPRLTMRRPRSEWTKRTSTCHAVGGTLPQSRRHPHMPSDACVLAVVAALAGHAALKPLRKTPAKQGWTLAPCLWYRGCCTAYLVVFPAGVVWDVPVQGMLRTGISRSICKT